MKILHFTIGRCSLNSANGVDKTTYYLALNQARAGHQVAIFSLSDKEVIPIENVKVCNFVSSLNPFTLPHSLFHKINEFDPQYVHLHSTYIPQNIVLAKFLRKNCIPYVVTPNGAYSEELLKESFIKKRIFRILLENMYLRKAVAIHAVSPNEATELQRNNINTNIVVEPNGVDLEQIPGNTNKYFFVDNFPEFKEKKIILFIGRLNIRQKGLDLLIEAVRLAKNEIKNTIFVLVGPDWNNSMNNLRRMITKYNLEKKVYIMGPLYGQDKFDALASSHIFVHTSRWEGLPFAVIEAMACGKPCIITKATNLSEFVIKYNAGNVTENSTESIAKSIKEFDSMSITEIDELGANAIALVQQKLDWFTISKNFTSKIETVIMEQSW